MSNVEISLNIGNLWDMLSAIGTVGACVISLYLIRKDRKRDLSMTVVWGQRDSYTAEVVCYNPSNQEVVLEKIYCRYCGKKHEIVNLLNDFREHRECEFPPHETKRITIQMPAELFEELSLEEKENTKGTQYKWHYRIKRKIRNKFSVVAVAVNGGKYKSTQRYSREKLLELFWGEGMMRGFDKDQ